MSTGLQAIALCSPIIASNAVFSARRASRGVDSIAEAYAKKNKLELIVFKPEYDKYPGKIAPLKRNDQIVEACDMLLAIWDGESRGTMYTVKKAQQMGKPVRVETVKPKLDRWDEILKKLPF